MVETQMGQMNTYKILDINMTEFEKRIEKLNKKAARLGYEPIQVFNFGTDEIEEEGGVGIRKVFNIMLLGDTPKINGWEFVATLNHIPDAGTIVRCLPGHTIDEKYREAEPFCDHCQLNRRRRDTYILKNIETGELQQVGKSCLAEFTDCKDPHKLASMAEIWTLAVGYAGVGGSYPGELSYSFLNLRVYLAYVYETIKDRGWVSRKLVRETGEGYPTSDAAYDRMIAYRKDPVKTENLEFADKVIEWAESFSEKENKSDYEHNVSLICSSGALEYRSRSLAASAVHVYQTYLKRLAAAASAPPRPSEFVGKIGERITFEAEVVGFKPIYRDFDATSYMYRFNSNGNILVWFASREYEELSVGSKHTVVGTVKKHDAFRDTKQTLLTRCKVL